MGSEPPAFHPGIELEPDSQLLGASSTKTVLNIILYGVILHLGDVLVPGSGPDAIMATSAPLPLSIGAR